jgi:putative oxidoreductase
MRQNEVGPRSIVLIRLLVGWVFVLEGILKFTRPDALGIGRFTKIGFVSPGLISSFVGWVEIICSALILLGFLTRMASVPLLIDISVAIVTTKIPILLGHGFWGFADPTVRPFGLGTMLHESRTDISMLLGLLFLLIAGAGRLSVDSMMIERR